MRPAKVQAQCPNCDHEFEAKAVCIRHLPLPKSERPQKRKIKKDSRDEIWAKQVKERDGYRCRRCGATADQKGLHAAHIISRRYKATRHLLANGLTLDYGCHSWGHANPFQFYAWVEQEMGRDQLDELRRLTQKPTKTVKRKGAA